MSLKKKKSELQKLIREYFLLSAVKRDDGKYLCPLTKTWNSEKDMHVAHYIDRNKNATRYEVDNLLLTSKRSNVYDAMVPDPDYGNKHIRDYTNYIGTDKASLLKVLSEEDIILYETVYDDYIEQYKKLIKNLENEY